jgi:curved DNA-binding protein CbpA
MAANQRPARNYYELLGITEDFPSEAIRSLRSGWAKKHHPHSGSEPDSALMSRINDACDVLGDPHRRASYDKQLAANRATSSSTAAPRPPASGPPRPGSSPPPRRPPPPPREPTSHPPGGSAPHPPTSEPYERRSAAPSRALTPPPTWMWATGRGAAGATVFGFALILLFKTDPVRALPLSTVVFLIYTPTGYYLGRMAHRRRLNP